MDPLRQHYAHGRLTQAILGALAAAGKDPDRLVPADLAPVDEFHLGGRPATIDLAGQMALDPDLPLLDIGCGLGGAARYFAAERGCRVTGIDLTEEYVQVAADLARRVALADRVSFVQGSALALPFAAASFGAATMLHVGMNVADKGRLFAEVRRVLRTGAMFGVYDVMREADGPLTYPMPWASTADTSFLATADAYGRLLAQAGFQLVSRRSRRDLALAGFATLRARAARGQDAAPPLGLHIVMGAAAGRKMANLADQIERGLLAPTEIVCRAM